MARVFNFSAGPAALPLEVLEEVKAGLLDWQDGGMSVMEISHRSKPFMAVAEQAEAVEAPRGVLIPEKAVAEDADGQYVFVVKDGSALRRNVQAAGSENGRVRVTTGLANGERVVDSLSDEMLLALADGQTVKEAN